MTGAVSAGDASMVEPRRNRRRANLRLALVLALVALVFYVAIWYEKSL